MDKFNSCPLFSSLLIATTAARQCPLYPKSGHVRCNSARLLCARSGHREVLSRLHFCHFAARFFRFDRHLIWRKVPDLGTDKLSHHGSNPRRNGRSPPMSITAPTLSISPEKVCFFIVKAHEYDIADFWRQRRRRRND